MAMEAEHQAGQRGDCVTCHRIPWWITGPQMVHAAHTVMSCCSVTFGQHHIVSVVTTRTSTLSLAEGLPLKPVDAGIFDTTRNP